MLLFLSVYLVVLLCLMLFLIHFSSFAFFIFTGSYVFFVRVIFRTFGCWCGWFLRHFYYHFERFELLWFIFLLNSAFVKYYPVTGASSASVFICLSLFFMLSVSSSLLSSSQAAYRYGKLAWNESNYVIFRYCKH